MSRESEAISETVLCQSHIKTNLRLLDFPVELNSEIAYLEGNDFGGDMPSKRFGEMARRYRQKLQRGSNSGRANCPR